MTPAAEFLKDIVMAAWIGAAVAGCLIVARVPRKLVAVSTAATLIVAFAGLLLSSLT